MNLKNGEPKASSSEMETEKDVNVLRKECDELETAVPKINKGCVQKSNKSNQKIGTPKEFLREMEEDVSASEKDCNNIKAATQVKLKTFEKREDTTDISGQLYEIYLVLLILLHGLTNKNITSFHLASNLNEASDFDDVVFSYTYKELNRAEKNKVTFLQAKHKEKTKNISLESFLVKTGKGVYDLKKYFKSYREIKKKFEERNSTHHFNKCEFIVYTNSLFKIGDTEKVYIKELSAEEDWILNFNGKRVKYRQLCFSENKNCWIKTFLGSVGISEEQFLSKLKICSDQPNQYQLKEIIINKIHIQYGVPRSNIKSVFADVKNNLEDWWEYLTEKVTLIQNAARHSIRFEVQDPVPGFTGREQSLRDLNKALQSTGRSVISQSASITGLGGIGKTELARKYVSQYSQDYDWINAETYETCSESFRRLAGDKLEVGIKNRDGEDKDITSIKSAKHNKKCLFIFANAECAVAENVTNFLPSGDQKPHVLITSRNQKWEGIKSLQLDLFTEEKSAEFIKKYLSERGIKCEENEIKSLGEIMQYLPLALRQALAYITMENERLQKWNGSYTLKGFEDKARELLGKAPKDVFDTYAKMVLTTWQVMIDKIKQNEIHGMQSELMLNIIAFFAPIITIFATLIGEKNVRGSVEILKQYSLVNLQGGEVSIHRLLQQVIRMMLQNEGKDIEIMEKTLCLFNDDISSNCIMHVRSVWDYAKNVNKVVENFSRVPLLIIDAYSMVMMTHTLFKDVLGDSHRDTLISLELKVKILYMQGRYNEAMLVCQELNEILGPDHPCTLTNMNNLALILDKLGKSNESLILCKLKEILGPNNPNTLVTMHNMASVLDSQGKYEESLILYKEVLCKQKEISGPDHPDTLLTMHNMAFVLEELGKYDESLIPNKEVLCKQKDVLGPDHPDTLTNMHNMALKKKYEESLILYKEVLRKRKEIFAPDHPSAINTMRYLASASPGNIFNRINRFLNIIFSRPH